MSSTGAKAQQGQLLQAHAESHGGTVAKLRHIRRPAVKTESMSPARP